MRAWRLHSAKETQLHKPFPSPKFTLQDALDSFSFLFPSQIAVTNRKHRRADNKIRNPYVVPQYGLRAHLLGARTPAQGFSECLLTAVTGVAFRYGWHQDPTGDADVIGLGSGLGLRDSESAPHAEHVARAGDLCPRHTAVDERPRVRNGASCELRRSP